MTTQTRKRPKPRTRSRRSTSSPNAAPAELGAFGRFCAALALEDGRPLELQPFQRTLLADYFAGSTETLILLPKKNGKSTLLAALALFHLISERDAECVIAAASRDQATILYDQAAGFVRRSEGLQERVAVKRGYREIRSLRDAGRIRVMAADVDTADGVIPTLALVDELHRHKSAELYGVFRDGLGPRQGRMLTISTAGYDVNSPLAVMRKAAMSLEKVQRAEAHRYCRTVDGAYVLHEWALEPGENREDMAMVKRANPASWHTPDTLRRRHGSPSMTPWHWARFACNVWTAAEEPWLPTGAWDALAQEGARIPDGAPVWLGIDLGLKHDSAAVVALHQRKDGRYVARSRVLDPPTDGSPLDIAQVEAEVRRAAARWSVLAAAYDPWRFERSAQALGDEGVFMVESPMTNTRMAPASEQLHEAVLAGRIVHDGDPVLAAHVMAGVTTETDRGWRITKRKSRDCIDALVALMIAYDLAFRQVQAHGARTVVLGGSDLPPLPDLEPSGNSNLLNDPM